MTALVEVNNVSKIYRSDEGVETPALQGVSVAVEKGEFVAIMGASGSGKSTLLHILGLLDRPTNGKYLLNGRNVGNLDDDERAYIRNKEFGFIFQAFHLVPRASVLENVMLPLQYSAVPFKDHKKLATEALEKVNMTHRLKHAPSQLSGGEKQRAVIARALVNKPYLLFADEPTGNLDSKTGANVMGMVDDLHKQGLTVMVITHETPTASYAQRVITLKDGKIADEQKTPEPHQHFNK